jgi:hypothetical protein
MMEVLISSETSVLARATRRNITEDVILHSHRREILNSYIGNCGLGRIKLWPGIIRMIQKWAYFNIAKSGAMVDISQMVIRDRFGFA